MKKILITGKNSYIGTSFEKWLADNPEEYQVDTVGTKNGEWKEVDFSQYDVVFHVAGIAHVKETKDNQSLYYQVNRDLAHSIAKKSKNEGIKHFIFLSSMSVYGIENGVITEKTIPKPTTAYGKSKLEAEELIRELEDDSFVLSILRPPMVYGKGCIGNYPRLVKIALKTPIFPNVNNKRSMIFIDNLSEFTKALINTKEKGIFFPQNKEYVNTSEMVKLIASIHGKRIVLTSFFNPLLSILNSKLLNKVFGDLIYETSYSDNIDLITFKESIKKAESK